MLYETATAHIFVHFWKSFSFDVYKPNCNWSLQAHPAFVHQERRYRLHAYKFTGAETYLGLRTEAKEESAACLSNQSLLTALWSVLSADFCLCLNPPKTSWADHCMKHFGKPASADFVLEKQWQALQAKERWPSYLELHQLRWLVCSFYCVGWIANFTTAHWKKMFNAWSSHTITVGLTITLYRLILTIISKHSQET